MNENHQIRVHIHLTAFLKSVLNTPWLISTQWFDNLNDFSSEVLVIV